MASYSKNKEPWERGSLSSFLDPASQFALGALNPRDDKESDDDPWHPVMLQLNPGLIDFFFERALDAGDILVPKLYLRLLDSEKDLAGGLIESGITIFARQSLLTSEERLQSLFGSDKEGSVLRLEVGEAVDDSLLDFEEGEIQEEDIPVGECAVVMATIDDGIAFAHDQFRTGTSSRVEFAWIMDATPSPAGVPTLLGRVLDRKEIENLLSDSSTLPLLDEDRFYRLAGLLDYSVPGVKSAAFRRAHGTHVMSQAAGHDPDGAERPIICVQLPASITAATSGLGLRPFLNFALDFVLDRASRIKLPNGEPAPLVINFSYGNFAGPHDGTGFIEDMIDKKLSLAGDRKVRMALPMGNGNLARHHAEIRFSSRPEATLNWRVQPNDRTISYVEAWLPPDVDPENAVKVTLTPPGGPESPPVGLQPGDAYFLFNNHSKVIAMLAFLVPPATGRGLIFAATAATEDLVSSERLAPAGIWQIKLKREKIASDKTIHAWVQRDETFPGFPAAGRQSFFEDQQYERFDDFGGTLDVDPQTTEALVRRSGTLSGFVNGELPVVVGGYVRSNGAMADYSATGGKPPITRLGPDCVAVSDRSPVRRGGFGAGSRSGSIVALNGTSVAAPQTARRMADKLAAGAEGDRGEIKTLANDHEGAASYETPMAAEDRAGSGRLTKQPTTFDPPAEPL